MIIMKLVIDIPDEAYDWLVNGFPDEEDGVCLLDIVKNGTPLSESEDCVSRQAVLEALRTIYDTHIIETEDGDEYIDYNDTVYEMEQLSPVTPQPKIAHVISDEDGNIKCSNCGSHDCWGNYCSECGANMQEVK